MSEQKHNDDIEVLDGLDDLFSEPTIKPEETVNEEKTENVVVDSIEEPEEVLSVLDEQSVVTSPKVEEPQVNDLNTKEIEEKPFTEFVPDALEPFENTKSETLMKEPVIETKVEPTSNPVTPELEEVFHFDFTDLKEPEEAKQEVKDLEPAIPKIDSLPEVSEEINHEPEEVEPKVEMKEEPESEPVLASFDSVLEPIEITESKEEKAPIEPVMPDLDPVVEETKTEEISVPEVDSDLEKTNYDINYNFADTFATNNNESEVEQPSIDDAFQFEPTLTAVESEKSSVMDNDLGKTVIIEPVEPKEVVSEEATVDSNTEVKEETTEAAPVENENALTVVENKEPEKKKKEEKEKIGKKKTNGRTIVFIVLVVLLLLAFVILLPTILEQFAI